MNDDPIQNFNPAPPRRRNQLPIILIIAGFVLQLYASGFLGTINNTFLENGWYLIFLGAGLDLILEQRRYIAGSILTVAAVTALLISFGGESVPEIRALFYRFWPLLLIGYGLDIFLRSRVFSAIFSFILIGGAVLIGILVTNGVLTIPNLPLPEGLTFPAKSFPLPAQQRQLSIPLPAQSIARVTLNMASGKLALRGEPLNASALTGEVHVTSDEKFTETSDVESAIAAYALTSEKRASASPGLEFGTVAQTDAYWKIELNEDLPIHLETHMVNGYQLINLSTIHCVSATLSNERGDIDVQLPYGANDTINISSQNGKIRIFIPKDVSAFITAPIDANVFFPETYVRSGNQIYPNTSLTPVATKHQITVNASAPNGSITILISEN